ncbi:MAG: hypothetical protein LBT99_02810 [Bifidobacteriaceae bacterium]|jgi:hypothetical protein|nr:hypothetical protein [Bifidobacteriaceae bacterium]
MKEKTYTWRYDKVNANASMLCYTEKAGLQIVANIWQRQTGWQLETINTDDILPVFQKNYSKRKEATQFIEKQIEQAGWIKARW